MSGQPLGDLTFVDGTPLNTPETAAAAAAHYGEILHPIIEDIAAMVWEFWLRVFKDNPAARWADLRIWKMDLRGAYTLICFGPDDAGLFGMLLTHTRTSTSLGRFAPQVMARVTTWNAAGVPTQPKKYRRSVDRPDRPPSRTTRRSSDDGSTLFGK